MDESAQHLPFAGHPHLPSPSFMAANHFGIPGAATAPQTAYERFERPYVDPIPSATPGRNGRRDIAPATSGQQRQCDYCGTTRTPMWRRGPRGKHTLCNACGVKWKDGRIQIPLEDGTVSTGPNPVFTPPFGQPHPAPARDGRDAAAILHSLGGGSAGQQSSPLRAPAAAFGYDPSSAAAGMRTTLPGLYSGSSGAAQHQAGSGDLHKLAAPLLSGSAAQSAWYSGGAAGEEHDERTLKKRKYLAGGACAGGGAGAGGWEAASAAGEAEPPLGSSERQRLEATIAQMRMELSKSQKEKESLASRLTTLSHAERAWQESAEQNKLKRRHAEDMVLRLCGLVRKNLQLGDQGMDDAVVQKIASALAEAPPTTEPEASEAFLNTLADAITREERLRTSKRVAIQSLTSDDDPDAASAPRTPASYFGKPARYLQPPVDSMNLS